MEVMVTGAGGYIGRHVVSALLDRGAEVIAVDCRPLPEVDRRAERLNVDIFSLTDDVLARLGRLDACLHLAWRDGFAHQSPCHMEMLSDHVRFIRQLAEQGVKQIAVMGTMHEIGYCEGAIGENTPCNPLSQYGIAKNALRQSLHVSLNEKSIFFQWLRGFYIYGDDRNNHSIFTKMLQAVENGQTEFPFTSGKNKYDFITVQNLAQQIACTVLQQTVCGIINVCSGSPLSLAEVVENFICDRKLPITLKYGAYPDRPYDSPAVWGDDTKIRQIMSRARPGLA